MSVLELLRSDEADGVLSIIEYSDADVLTDDFELDKLINYHIKEPDAEWLSGLFWFGEKTEDYKPLEPAFIDLLLKADLAMLVNLRGIFFASCEEDIAPICEKMQTDEFDWPSKIDFDDKDVIGCYWHSQSAVIISTAAIDQYLNEEAALYEDCYYDFEEERWIAAATTLLHEIRHLGLSNPYLDERKYPSWLESEENVEGWALATFEAYS